MSADEILAEADEIRERFKKSDRPLTTEESKILEQAHELRAAEAAQDAFGYGGYPIN